MKAIAIYSQPTCFIMYPTIPMSGLCPSKALQFLNFDKVKGLSTGNLVVRGLDRCSGEVFPEGFIDASRVMQKVVVLSVGSRIYGCRRRIVNNELERDMFQDAVITGYKYNVKHDIVEYMCDHKNGWRVVGVDDINGVH